jgi:hypothetical protein
VNLKTRLLAGASTLALVGSIAAVGASSAHAAPTVIGACHNNNAVAGIKNTVTGAGLVNTLPPVGQADKIGVKSVNAPTCVGAVAGVDASSLKASIVGSASCDTSLTPPFPPSGKLGFTQAGGTVKDAGYVRFASIDPTGSIYYQDVIGLHGIMTKGPIAGADIDGSLSQNPTVKDKTLPSGSLPGALGPYGSFTGYDVNAFDSLAIGGSCLAGSSSGILLLNDGSGAPCVAPGKGCIAAPTAITTTLVADGPSLLEGTGLVTGAGGGTTPAQGLVFSVY